MPIRGDVANRLLASLPPDALAKLMPDFERIPMRMREFLHEPKAPTPYVYFPNFGVISLLVVLRSGTSVELATVGNEGMVDIATVLGLADSESQSTVQVPGEAFRMKSELFRDHLERDRYFRALLNAYAMELFTMTAQNTACSRAHNAVQRCARWILMTHDRVNTDEFPITHEFLSEMLGVRRPTVTGAATALQDKKLIWYRHGVLRVLDRAGLQKATCECYELIRDRFDLLPGRANGIGRPLASGLWVAASPGQ